MKNLYIIFLISFSTLLFAQTDSTKFMGGPGSGYAMAESGSIPLPVELSSFSAILNKENIFLKWQTKTEIDNYGFEIERSNNKIRFETVGFKEGSGNSNSPKYYEFTDNSNLNNGKYFYRLKQIDNDGSFEYSKTIEVEVNRVFTYSLAQNYPNPFNPVTNISFQIPEKALVTLKLYNILGNEVAVILNQNLDEGEHTVQFNGAALPSGVYFYKISSGQFSDTKKLTIIK